MIAGNVRNVPAPSIDAASSSFSCGDLKNCVMKKNPEHVREIGNAIPNKVSTSRSGEDQELRYPEHLPGS